MDALLLFSFLRVNGLVMEKITNLIVEWGIANWEFFNCLGQVLRKFKATCQLWNTIHENIYIYIFVQ
jgi:hypothetical protein